MGPLQQSADLETSDLVLRHLAGDARAFRMLVERHHPRLLNFLTRMIGDRERAEDLAQDTFSRVSRHLHRFDTSRRFTTWLFTIASNLAKNEIRARRRSPLVFYQSARPEHEDEPMLQIEDPGTRPDTMLARHSLADLIEETLGQLRPLYREVLVLRDVEGRSYHEIGAIAGCNLGAVKSRLHRARTSFVSLIGPRLEQ